MPQDAGARLLSAFRCHPWLWELLIRKHLWDLLQHVDATAAVAEAVMRLDAGSQAKACSLIRTHLAVAPVLAHTPGTPQLLHLLLQQLKQCFQVLSHELPGLEAAGAAGLAKVVVQLREQLPALLHLLLAMACGSAGSGSAGSGSTMARPKQPAAQTPGEATDGGAGSVNVAKQQHASSAGQLSPSALEGQLRQSEHSDGTHCDLSGSSAAGSVQDAVLKYAVILIGKLSDADALHDMLGLELQPADLGAAGQRQPAAAAAVATVHATHAASAAGSISVQEAARVHCALQLSEVLLDALLALPALAGAVRQQLHSRTGGNQEQETCGGSAATGQQRAEVLETACSMLALHWELSKLLVAVGKLLVLVVGWLAAVAAESVSA